MRVSHGAVQQPGQRQEAGDEARATAKDVRRSTTSEPGIEGRNRHPDGSQSGFAGAPRSRSPGGHRFVAEYMVGGVGNGALNGPPYSRPSPAPASGRQRRYAVAPGS